MAGHAVGGPVPLREGQAAPAALAVGLDVGLDVAVDPCRLPQDRHHGLVLIRGDAHWHGGRRWYQGRRERPPSGRSVCSRRAGGPVRRRRGRPDALRAGARRPARRHHGDRQRRRRHGAARPPHQPRPRHRHLHPGRHGQPRDRVGRGRRELGRHGRAGAAGRRGLVPPGRSRPGHPPLPHRPAPRRRAAQRGDGRAGPAPRHRGAAAARDRRRRCAPGSRWPRRASSGPPGTEVGFQDYFVRLHHDVAVRGVRFEGADAARPAPGVLDALARRRHHRGVPFEPGRLHRPGAGRARRARRPGGAPGATWWPCRPSSPAPRSRARPTG